MFQTVSNTPVASVSDVDVSHGLEWWCQLSCLLVSFCVNRSLLML